MTPEQWAHVKELFQEALERPEAERHAFLTRRCGADQELLQAVTSLLQQHRPADDLPTGSQLQAESANLPLADLIKPLNAPTESAGDSVDHYKLLQKIGEGGFGIVYMAQQETPIRRRVALKIIKPGMDSAQVIARFEAERQALAIMDHPNIARVFDAGTTPRGRPYFVMELVQGVPITQYCDAKRLTPRQRLELFIPVCQAIQHAHQKGIIHRDLKPSNVLIATFDGKPMPKVIDFGVAKALNQRLTEKTLFTQFGCVVGTPEYMSPEQTENDILGVDTRSDIYSLGVVLYELLTGATPLDAIKLRAEGYARMMQAIRETEPPKPSTRLHNSGETLAAVSAARSTEPRHLERMVAGDLDWIVMKALEKDRTRRYESPSALASDVQHFLHAEPVNAAAPTMGYLFSKFARRHRAALATATALLTMLLLAAGISMWEWRKTEQARAVAQSSAADAREKLRLSYLAQAHVSLLTPTAGRRFNTLEAVRQSTAIKPSLEARNAAASALVLPDLRIAKEWEGNPPDTSLLTMDATGERYARGSGDGTVSVRLIANDRELWRFPGRGGSIDWVLRFSPDGRFLVATDYHPTERHLHAWDLLTGATVLDVPLAVTGGAFDFQPRTSNIAAVDEAGRVHWFDLASGRQWSWPGSLKNPYALRFRKDGLQVAVSSLDQPGISIFEAESGTLVAALSHPGGVRFPDWSADGHFLAAPCADSNIYIWALDGTPRMVRVLKGHETVVCWVAFHPSGDLLLSGSWDGTTALWSRETGSRWCHWVGGMHQMALSANGRWLGFATVGPRIQLLEVTAAESFHWLHSPNNQLEASGHFSPDGRWLATGNRDGVTIWDTALWQAVCQQPLGAVKYLTYSANGESLYVVTDAQVAEWPVMLDENGKPVLGVPRRLDVAPSFAMCSVSRDNSVVAVAHAGVWVEDRLRSQNFYLNDWTGCNQVAVSPDGRWVAALAWNTPELHVWDLSTRKQLEPLTAYGGRIVFSPDGRWLIAVTNTDVCFWEVDIWQPKSIARGDFATRGSPSLTVAANGRCMAVENARCMPQIRALPSFEPLVSLWSIGCRPVSLSPDGSLLLVQMEYGTHEGSLGIWDLRRAREELGRMGLGWEN